MEHLKYDVETEEEAVDHAVQEFPDYESFFVAGYTASLPGRPGYYTVFAFEDEDDRLKWEEILDGVEEEDFLYGDEVLEDE